MRHAGRFDKGELAVATLLLASAVVLYVVTTGIKGEEQGTRLFPQVYVLVIGVGAAVTIAQELLLGPKRRQLSLEAVDTEDSAQAEAPLYSTTRQPHPVDEDGSTGGSDARTSSRTWLDRIPGPVLVGVVVAGYIILLDSIGYLLSTVIFATVLTAVFSRRLSPKILLFPVGLTLCLYLIFEQLLNIRLP